MTPQVKFQMDRRTHFVFKALGRRGQTSMACQIFELLNTSLTCIVHYQGCLEVERDHVIFNPFILKKRKDKANKHLLNTYYTLILLQQPQVNHSYGTETLVGDTKKQ